MLTVDCVEMIANTAVEFSSQMRELGPGDHLSALRPQNAENQINEHSC